MDNNNNPAQPIPNIQPNPVVNQPPQAPIPTPPAQGGNKMALWLIGGFILIILVVAGIYVTFSRSAKEAEKPPLAFDQPVTRELDDVSETEVEAVGVGDLDSEFSSVDQDLKSL